ncbi:MAG TPA: alpha-glucan family phosphorylase [Bryobacteraceae bacterium]|nr:alpha-glucan family phosphorylase [Bryobacteraceae bacterium]
MAENPQDHPQYEALRELALNLQWSWRHSSDELWGKLDPELWELTQNPWAVLQAAPRKRLNEVFADGSQRVNDILREHREALDRPKWFQHKHADSPLKLAAYFSMEYMLSEALPIYSGGLGNVAGDQLKAASDLGVPVVAIGLLYQQGYFRQEIDSHGAQRALYPYNDPSQLPISPLCQPDGEWLRIPIDMTGYKIWLRCWKVAVGHAKLYLLDSNDMANPPAVRGVTSELYGGDSDLRLKQELILGVGGWRLLRALGLRPEICHLNEGHAAFAILERARSFMQDYGVSFDVALAATRAGNLFTTHTAVDAGFDRFAPELAAHYLGPRADALGISLEKLLGLGRKNPDDHREPFNMAYLALRGSGAVNGVSRLHGEVSRRLFSGLFPRWPESEVPVGYITNGIHPATWESPEAAALWERACGPDRSACDPAKLEEHLRALPDSELWELRTKGSRGLIEYARRRLARQRAGRGDRLEEIAAAQGIFNFDTLTMGFARRFATYKRPNLLLHDPDRLARILTNAERPVQLVIAGKAHPADLAGQAMIAEWYRFLTRPEVRPHVAFLEDYDMLLSQQMVQGVDLWINTPRRPWEASGTSGMKVLANGGMNLSELDGWWAEAYSPQVGWAIGDGKEHGEDPNWDAAEAEALYALLEREIIPKFYRRDSRGIPTEWIAMMRESMARLTPQFSAYRTVREYTDNHYVPGAIAYCRRAAEHAKPAVELVAWQRHVFENWPHVRFGQMNVETKDGSYIFEVSVYLDDVTADSARVELYADGIGGSAPVRVVMEQGQELLGSVGGYTYRATVSASRPASDFTARVVPFHEGAVVPLDAAEILWQR